MREILFRGKRVDNGEWVEGLPFFEENRCYIIEDLFICDEYQCTGAVNSSVIPETVGQFTGLTDKNSKKIFEGDVVKCKDYLEVKPFEFQGYIDFQNGSFVIVGEFMTHYRWLDYEVEIIGNIHDNPELLEV